MHTAAPEAEQEEPLEARKQYCSGAGVDLEGTVEKLRAAGMKAEATMTLRDLADSGGVHPREIRPLL